MKLKITNDSEHSWTATVLIDGEPSHVVESVDIRITAEGEQSLIIRSFRQGQGSVTDWLDITGLSIEIETREG